MSQKAHKNRTQEFSRSVLSNQFPVSGMLPTSKLVPRIVLTERFAFSDRRDKARERLKPVVADFVRNRLPLLGLRSQQMSYQGRLQSRGELYPGRSALVASLREAPGTTSVCQRRTHRRQQLFRMGIAGHNKKRSPGQGGSYRRTADSYYTCRSYRK